MICMEQNAVNALMAQWSDKIPSDSVFGLQEELKSLNSAGDFYVPPLKSKVVGLILGLFLGLFGADRFYKGDKILGIIKLALFLAYGVMVGITAAVGGDAGVIFALVGSTFFGVLTIWCIVDLFLVWGGIQRNNLRIIQQAIANAR